MGIKYRIDQFFHSLVAQPSEQDLAIVDINLTSPLAELFHQMSFADQSHSLRVFTHLSGQGETEPSLLAAALLHDVGKCRAPLKPWDRALVVLVKVVMPDLISNWGAGEPRGWKKPFVVYLHHAEWGAQMVDERGGSDLCVYLIRHHQDKLTHEPGDHREMFLAKLQTADGMN
jgi:hypothetical protein